VTRDSIRVPLFPEVTPSIDRIKAVHFPKLAKIAHASKFPEASWLALALDYCLVGSELANQLKAYEDTGIDAELRLNTDKDHARLYGMLKSSRKLISIYNEIINVENELASKEEGESSRNTTVTMSPFTSIYDEKYLNSTDLIDAVVLHASRIRATILEWKNKIADITMEYGSCGADSWKHDIEPEATLSNVLLHAASTIDKIDGEKTNSLVEQLLKARSVPSY
jgi:hypothetical protein